MSVAGNVLIEKVWLLPAVTGHYQWQTDSWSNLAAIRLHYII